MPNLQDIADDLSVSVSLVSKVLNGRLGTTGASEKTIQAIQNRAREMGYTKNTSAAALATGKHNVIGVYIHHHGVAGSGIVEAMVEGITQEARERGQRLLLSFFTGPEEFRKISTEIHRNVLDGILIGGLRHDELNREFLQIKSRGIPIVMVCDHQAKASLIPNVGVDQFEIGRLATEHLLAQGCRKIAHIDAVKPTAENGRLFGYQAALRDAGIHLHANWVIKVPDYTHARGRQAAEEFLRNHVEFDGLFAQSDQLAIGAMHYLLERGLRIPQDIKIIGVDNSPYCEFSIVPLTSVSQQEQIRGKMAVSLLLDQLSGKKISSLTVPPVLTKRVSTQN